MVADNCSGVSFCPVTSKRIHSRTTAEPSVACMLQLCRRKNKPTLSVPDEPGKVLQQLWRGTYLALIALKWVNYIVVTTTTTGNSRGYLIIAWLLQAPSQRSSQLECLTEYRRRRKLLRRKVGRGGSTLSVRCAQLSYTFFVDTKECELPGLWSVCLC